MLRSVLRFNWNASIEDKLTCMPSRGKQTDLPCTIVVDPGKKIAPPCDV